ncbi:Extracellular protein 28-3 [Teratosphaeria destructans]|uniref:Extracellular protein 28-3 n=1 Tax=Teratosphaeria destructans TaxID=418781 RepID=A0A9W7SPR9_9PEZI|nr:Extracellular protein 28-3 [Teratosphaeria destructans]
MQLTQRIVQPSLLLFLALGVEACARYKNCKCYDGSTNLAADDITQVVCKAYQYGRGYFHNLTLQEYPDATNQCYDGKGLINCDWNTVCREHGNFYQVCWDKTGHAYAGESSGFCGNARCPPNKSSPNDHTYYGPRTGP